MSTAPIKQFLTEREAADFLGFRPATLRQSRWSGYLAGAKAPEPVRFGRNVRYELTELERWARRLASEVPA